MWLVGLWKNQHSPLLRLKHSCQKYLNLLLCKIGYIKNAFKLCGEYVQFLSFGNIVAMVTTLGPPQETQDPEGQDNRKILTKGFLGSKFIYKIINIKITFIQWRPPYLCHRHQRRTLTHLLQKTELPSVSKWSIPAANREKEGVSPGTAPANFPDPGNPKGAGQIESTALGWVCQHCYQANLDKLVIGEASNSRDEGWEKRKGEIDFGSW